MPYWLAKVTKIEPRSGLILIKWQARRRLPTGLCASFSRSLLLPLYL